MVNRDRGQINFSDLNKSMNTIKKCMELSVLLVERHVNLEEVAMRDSKVREFLKEIPEFQNRYKGPEKNSVTLDMQKSDFDKYMNELNSLIGLGKVKEDVKELVNLLCTNRLRQENGLQVAPTSLHLVFRGNPGTGKTTVARLLGKIYKSIGVLSKGHLIETDRTGLVGQYIGHTEEKTQKLIESAMGGVLFIDEAYSLAGKGEKDFGNEAVEVLLKQMEDRRDQFIVIVAGYNNEMDKFIRSNPGLESRFNKYIDFEDYSTFELYDIFNKMCGDNDYRCSKKTYEYIIDLMKKLVDQKDEHFANGRTVRNIFEKTITNQASRIMNIKNPTREDLMGLEICDFEV